MSECGKIVRDALYVHKSSLTVLNKELSRNFLEAMEILNFPENWNVVKFDLNEIEKISFLEYNDFWSDPFPALLTSVNVNLQTKVFKRRHYSPTNPPILHRKELLLLPDNAHVSKFAALTKKLDELGAFESIYRYGTKLRWEERLIDLGIEIRNHKVRLLSLKGGRTTSQSIARHRTAIKRKSLSSCMGALLDTSLISLDTEIFDFGCGRGDDIAILAHNKFENVSGWDPHYAPNNPIPQVSDYVTLSFVLNVIEDPQERHEVFKKAYSMARTALVFSVLLEHQADLQLSKPMNDGFVSSKNTFQKYYDHAEIVELVSEQLNERAIKLAPGVYIVFKDKDREQEYLFKRQLGLLVDTSSQTVKDSVDTYATPLVDKMRDQIMSFGRIPLLSELPKEFTSQLSKAAVSYTRLSRLALSQVAISDLQKVGEVFASEILIFLAINMFERRVKYGSLPEKLQNDVKVHFGSLKSAEKAAEDLLFSLSNTDALVSSAVDAEKNRLGRLVGDKFRFHCRRLSELPVDLRLFAKIGERLHRPVKETEIIQLHLSSKKMSYLTVNDFDRSPLPRIASREIVKFYNQEVSKFSHEEKGDVRILYLKSMYMSDGDANLSAQQRFDDVVRCHCSNLFEEGDPSFDVFARQLIVHKIAPPKY